MTPGVHLYYNGEIDDGKGKITKIRTHRARSFVKQFPQLLLGEFMGTIGTVSMRDTGNTLRSTPYSGAMKTCITSGYNTGTSYSTHGLVIGSGSTSIDISQYKLVTQIAHGSSAGQLNYGSMSTGAPNYDPDTGIMSVYFTRLFSNGSGGNVAVNEIGVYMRDSTSTWYFMLIRELT